MSFPTVAAGVSNMVPIWPRRQEGLFKLKQKPHGAGEQPGPPPPPPALGHSHTLRVSRDGGLRTMQPGNPLWKVFPGCQVRGVGWGAQAGG